MDLRSHYPFWLMKNGIVKSYPSLHKDLEVDITIIGAGISGALAAYHLQGLGYSIAVIDKRHPGMGSTAASTALLQYEIDTPMRELSDMIGEDEAVQSYRVCRDALYSLKDICKSIYPECIFPIKPSLQYASSKKDMKDLLAEYEMRKKYGFDVEWLEEKDIEKMFGFAAPGALLSAEASELDAYMLTHRLLQHSQENGVQIYDNTSITEISHKKGYTHLRTDDGVRVKTKHLVMATGYESLKYIPKKVASLHSTYALVTEQMPEQNFWYKNCLIWETRDPYLYFRVTDDNRILMGGKDDPFYNPDLRDSRIKKKTKSLEDAFRKKFPKFDIKTDFSWAGTFAVTKDGLPYIGTIQEMPHTYFALGYGGNGIIFSVVAAGIIRDMIMKKENKHAGLFSFTR